MLSIKEIHFSIEENLQGLGSYVYGDIEPEQVDDAINAVLSEILIHVSDTKNKHKLNSVEKLIYNSSLVRHLEIPVKENDDYVAYLHSSNANIVNVNVLTYDKKCKKKVTEIQKDKIYLTESDVKYQDKWYSKCSIIKATDDLSYYGDLSEVKSKIEPAFELDYHDYASYNNYFKTPVWTVESDNIRVKSRKPIAEIQYSYIKTIDNIKVDYCSNKTLMMSEDVQRYVIDKVVLRLAVRTEHNQQKIANLKSETI